MLREPDNASGVVEMNLGKLFYWYGNGDPSDGLICDGRLIKYANFPELVEWLNAMLQTGNPRKDVNLPDLRGCFIRGVGGLSAKIGVRQDFGSQNITGKFNGNVNDGNYFTGVFYSKRNNYETPGSDGGNGMGGYIHFDASRQIQTAEEVRPLNVAFHICIGTGRLVLQRQKKLKVFLVNFLCKILTSTREGGEIKVCLDYQRALEEKY